jgi:hypothetical protein
MHDLKEEFDKSKFLSKVISFDRLTEEQKRIRLRRYLEAEADFFEANNITEDELLKRIEYVRKILSQGRLIIILHDFLILLRRPLSELEKAVLSKGGNGFFRISSTVIYS